MTTTFKRRTRTREEIGLDQSVERFLLTGEAERDTAGWELRTTRFFGGDEIRRAWLGRRKILLLKWRKEKRRGLPWAETYLK